MAYSFPSPPTPLGTPLPTSLADEDTEVQSGHVLSHSIPRDL